MHQYIQWNEVDLVSLMVIWATVREKLNLLYANNKGTDQSAHPRRLIGAFVIHSLDSIIAKLAT